ncbi:glycosyltransferase family 39 protein [uncultured Pontibacter sp.]|uniref:ArnT family glycosyltransferase n=1 Tax=uncultured Pontibacter sp. TaxID=453356 RepID=UPI00260E5934|nr:glycosyltransferase family 39 protein [uncultured Pontibacter sp.]
MLLPHKPRTDQFLMGLLLVLFLLLLFNLDGWGIMETSEARYAEISREMWLTGDLLHPRLLGIQHYQEPPLTYIITAIGIDIFGPNGFGARFFLQVSLLVQVWLVYLIAKELFHVPRQALLAALIYLTIPAVLLSARHLTSDSYLATFELAAILAWLKYKTSGRAVWLYFFYLLLALAFLTKGPLGLIFPLFAVIGFSQHYSSVSGYASGWHHLPAALLFLLLGSSWFVYLILQHPQLLDYFLYKYTWQYFTDLDAFGPSKPWWFYFALAPVLSLPWFAILLLQLKKLAAMPAALKRLFLFWIIVPLIFFSFLGPKLIFYILPVFAGQALLTTWIINHFPTKTMVKAVTGSMLYFALLLVALIALPLLPLGINLPWRLLSLPFFSLLLLLVLWNGERSAYQKIMYGALLLTALLVPFSTKLLAYNPQLLNGSRQIAEVIKERELQHRPVLVYNRLLPSLAFELNSSIISLEDGSSKLEREVQFEQDGQWREQLLQLNRLQDLERLRQLLQQQPVLVVKGKLPEERQWMLQYFNEKLQIRDWRVYY